MISCERAWELLSQQLDEPLSPREKQELEEHLAVCPSCRKDKEELEQLDQALRNLGEIQAPADFTQRVMAQVQQQTQSKPKVIPLWRRPQVRALAGLAACALLCIGIYRSLPQDGNLSGGMVTSDQGEVSSQSSGTADGSQSDSATQYGVDPAQAPDDGGNDPASVPQPRTADPQPEVESSATQGSQSSGQTPPTRRSAVLRARVKRPTRRTKPRLPALPRRRSWYSTPCRRASPACCPPWMSGLWTTREMSAAP